MTDDTREYTFYVEYDARIMWRDDNDKTGQVGPTYHSHDARGLVAERLNGLRVGLVTDQFVPSEVSDNSFVVALNDEDAKRVKAGKVTITPDGVEAGSDGVPTDDSKSKPPKDSTDALGRREVAKGDRTNRGDATPPQAADQSRARDSKKDGPDRGDAAKEPNRKVTANR